MPIDFRNTNSLWASIAVETLARLGLQTAILCPGSRSTPLTVAFANHSGIETLPILDERSAAFFALGCAKRQHSPVAIVCTSGTAGANFYPAIIEAYESGVPLLVFTADRPPEMRDCASGQTIDQIKLFGGFVKRFVEMAVPVADLSMLSYLRQTLVSGWESAITPHSAPIHFNCPFRNPLAPTANSSTHRVKSAFNTEKFFHSLSVPVTTKEHTDLLTSLPIADWQSKAGIIIAGPANPSDPTAYCKTIFYLSQLLDWPVLAEGLSALRNYLALNPFLVSSYDLILRDSRRAAKLVPECVLQLGALPTSKVLRQWLQRHQPHRWIVGPRRNLDPLHGPTHRLFLDIEAFTQPNSVESPISVESPMSVESPEDSNYCQQWMIYERKMRGTLEEHLTAEPDLVESKVVWLLSKHLPEQTPLFVANSMPVRDLEYFWPPNDRRIQPVFSRGANGIDGTLSTAMGIAHRNRPTVLLSGDLAFLHDTNGLLNTAQLWGHLTIVLINNGGGGIFEMLPVANFSSTFEEYFITPQQVEFSSLCRTYGVEHQLVQTVEAFVEAIRVLPEKGIRVLEVACDRVTPAEYRKLSVARRKALLNSA
ncbi:2-succinyl-6-hydroxy-2,4-cyclohexadiene-1-carboxylic acid synthase/2-oxoglutarate decarboxylase [Synechococcus sp. PCC 7335]|uniref:2-succinyl-5-enolpyruvyl-6-hydroxy-3- cyclohexene-1-carboxylic-acid synthase n=1 Tax=Synechococcus sp. (strain ATCC 29403 / PCC 7335) TaxID=91464 RepID=UPI00017EE0C4|nr:2-succinyl-5-enolpyruvyl-6-hydroxy-3-cyclohexene-1-carboxylic-acid synthase [Synechococcus sp. PCC 7335]EDX87557.1 2-succinyl-6-hydroxy-2,4-cyclohexadiene-1-carboxylic acid synthase/2-oxoglutarate decarboxylase [Synechococcus sp. PCC 7335]